MTFRSTDATRYNKSDFLEEVYMDEASYDAIVSLLKRKKEYHSPGCAGYGENLCCNTIGIFAHGRYR